LLAEAGYPNGIDLEWKVIGSRPDTVKVAEISKETFRRGGVNLKLVQLEFATWIQQVYRDKQFQLAQTIFLREADPDGLVVSALFTGGQKTRLARDGRLAGAGRGLDRDKRAPFASGSLPRSWRRAFLGSSAAIRLTRRPGRQVLPRSQCRPFVALREMSLAK
jgi:hypothetical protein